MSTRSRWHGKLHPIAHLRRCSRLLARRDQATESCSFRSKRLNLRSGVQIETLLRKGRPARLAGQIRRNGGYLVRPLLFSFADESPEQLQRIGSERLGNSDEFYDV